MVFSGTLARHEVTRKLIKIYGGEFPLRSLGAGLPGVPHAPEAVA